MTDLITRLLEAKWPDRALADEVLLACGWKTMVVHDTIVGSETVWMGPSERGYHYSRPDPLASLDAAVGLVPEGDYDQSWSKSSRGKDQGFKLWQVRLSLDTVADDPDETGPVALGEHDSPAIALVVACLRAREAT